MCGCDHGRVCFRNHSYLFNSFALSKRFLSCEFVYIVNLLAPAKQELEELGGEYGDDDNRDDNQATDLLDRRADAIR